jgi:putative transposase
VKILQDAETGIPVKELIRQHRFSKATFYKWKAKYGRMSVSGVKRMKELEEENRRLKRMYPNLSLKREILKDSIKKTLPVAEKRKLARSPMQKLVGNLQHDPSA